MIEIPIWLFIVLALLSGGGVTITGIVIYGSILGRKKRYQEMKNRIKSRIDRVEGYLSDIHLN